MALSDLGTVYVDLDDLMTHVKLVEAQAGQAAASNEMGVTASTAHNMVLGDKVTLVGFSDSVDSIGLTGNYDVIGIDGPTNAESLNNAFIAEIPTRTGNLAAGTTPTPITDLEPGLIVESATNRFIATADADMNFSTSTTLVLPSAGDVTALNIVAGDYIRVLNSNVSVVNDVDGIYKVSNVSSATITINGSPTAGEITDGVLSAFAQTGLGGNTSGGAVVFKVLYTPSADPAFKSIPSGTFFTSHINIDALNKKFRFVATPGNSLDDDGAGGARTDPEVLDGTFYRAGSGIQGQALYSFFKYAWKEVSRLPQFSFPMLSITNEQFEFQNGWYLENTALSQRLQLDGLELTITDDAGGDILSIPSTQGEDLRQFESGDALRILFDSTNASDVTVLGGSDPTKLSLVVAETTLNTGLKSGASLSASFSVVSTDLIRTAGFSIPSQDNTYTKLFYSGIITLGTFVDVVDQPYYVQENTATASTTNTVYTGPANQPLPMLKLANAGTGGNNNNDINFVAGNTSIANATGYTFANTGNTITSNSGNEFVGISDGDIIEVTGSDQSGVNDRKFTVVSRTDTVLTVDETVTDSVGLDTTATIVVLPHIYAPSFTGANPTDLTIFNAGDQIGVSGTASNTTFGLQRIGDQQFSGSANTVALTNAPAGVRLAFDSTVSITDESSVGAIIDNDLREYFKLFLRERGKSYAESSLSDIGVDTLTNIVYRFPVTNIADVKITSTDDSDIDSNDAVPADVATFGPNSDQDLSKLEIVYLRNPQTNADNLTISGDYTAGTSYNAGDVVRDGATLADQWYYVSNEQPLRTGVTSVQVDGVVSPHTFSSAVADDIVFDPAAQTITLKGDQKDNFFVGDRITIAGGVQGQAGDTDGNDYLISSTAFSTDTTLTLDTTNGDSLLDVAGSNAQYSGDTNNSTVSVNAPWTRWDKKAADPDKGGYLATGEPALQGGEREIKNPTPQYYIFDVIIDADTARLDTTTPYVSDAADALSTDSIYEFVQWALRLETHLNEDASTPDQFKKTGKIADLLIDFVGDTLTTREGVFIEDIDDTFQNAVSFVDYNGNIQTYPTVVACKLVFNNNLAGDADAVFYLYYTNLADDQGSGLSTTTYDFGNVSAKQVYQQNGSLVGSSINNKCQAGTLEPDGTSRSFSFTYAFSEDNADPENANPKQSEDGKGIKPTGSNGANEVGGNTDVTAVAIGLGTGAYVVATGQITDGGLTINLVAPLERNYINP